MARRRAAAPAGSTPVDAITHNDKRPNLPTVGTEDFVEPEMAAPIPVRYPRDPTLDPQLVWKGKDALDGEDLVADAPPLFIQEKIDPRVLIEDLRRRDSARAYDAPSLFETFDGLPELDLVEFYRHAANWSNRMILGDSLNVMASLAEREALRGKVQMIYIDPPYGIKFGSNWQSSTSKRDVKDGKIEDASREVEQIKAFRDTWEFGVHSYLTYLRDRLVVANDLVTESGSVFVQMGDENVHLVRAVMDEVFGSENFVAAIPFRKTSAMSSPVARVNTLATVTDFVLWYAKDIPSVKYRQLYAIKTVDQAGGDHYRQVESPSGEIRRMTSDEASGRVPLPNGWRACRADNLISQGHSNALSKPFDLAGRPFTPAAGSHWKTTQDGLEVLAKAGRLLVTGRTLSYKRYFDDFPVMALTNAWMDIGSDPDKVYVVQTTTKVIERCMLMTTDPGDLVLDPTCGSGTTAYVAEQWGRRWITIDTSRVALALARQRLMGARFPYYLLSDSAEGRKKDSELSGSALPPAEATNDIRHGFVYERVQHITLKSIANNPDIKEGTSRAEIEAAIRRHADYELLYDKPVEDPKRVRVAGPFTVESLSPHRSLAFAGSAVDGTGRTVERPEGASRDDGTFEQTILANLRMAGIQNGRKQEKLMFDSVETYAATHIQALAVRKWDADGTHKRVGLTIGPQYGTVGPAFIKDAARDAIRAGDLDLLCVLAFAFDPAVLGTGDDYVASDEGFDVAAERRLGRVPVLLVRMNADLVMGEALKKTGKGNLFTVFGEPDIEVKVDGDKVRLLLRGVDVYDPNTGELRSNDTDQIALWMVDTAYNGESFFVRQCYFLGGQDPYKRLKAALRADIDEVAWASLYRAESRPFPLPETGQIAVKVINDYGDEVLKVFTVS